MDKRTSLTENEQDAFSPTEKIGLIATVNPQGLPHISLITSLSANRARELVFGEFCKGKSKRHLQENPRTSFLIMTADKRYWRGKANWTQKRREGPEFEKMNEKPMFRYNSYFGIHTVHYLDLLEISGPESLPLGSILHSSLFSTLSSLHPNSKGSGKEVLNTKAGRLINKSSTLKFLCYVDATGYPVIIPAIQIRWAHSDRMIFSKRAYAPELERIPPKTDVAVFALNLQMESLLLRATFTGFYSRFAIDTGTLQINWAYNSMPPAHGQIFPQPPLEPITDFNHH